MDQFPEDCLPPEHTYASRDDLFQAINDWASPRGYAFVTGRSNKSKSGRLTVYFTCDRARRPPSASRSRVRATCTRSTLCPFSVIAKELPDASGWVVRHRSDNQYAVHNHTPSTHPTAHPVLRRLSKDDKSTISNLTKAGISSKEIRTYMRQHSNSIATQKDISNSIAEARRSSRFGENTMHALINQLDQEGFWNRMQVDSEGRVTAVLFAHPDSLAYLQAYSDLLLLDCTYKTNRYGMPLLDIIGVDACQRSFCVAFAFLSGEEEQDYLWALERLKSLYEICNTSFPSVIITDCALACINAVAICFPSAVLLLCLWHANKAVLAYCRPAFIQYRTDPKIMEAGLLRWQEFYNQWHSIIQSADQITFDQRVQQLEQRYLPAYANEIAYLHATWLNPHKEKLVKAWVDQHLHFGTVVTSRVEGIHSLLKSYLNTSTLDLFEAWGAITRAVTNQVHQLQSNQAQQQLRQPIELRIALYSAVQGWVSFEALRKVEEQRKRLLDKNFPLPRCTGVFMRTLGLPCAHLLQTLQEQGKVLLLDHFHKHWHLKRSGQQQLLLEPRARIDARPAVSNLPKSSTRRLPSSFEAAEAIGKARAKAPSKCSRCHEVGHQMNSKACPLRHQELLERVAAEAKALAVTEASAMTTAPTALADQPETMTGILQDSTGGDSRRQGSPVHKSSPLPGPPSPSPPRYDSPQAIYGRYVAARSAWYAAQPAGSIKTNQQYRRAMGLPLRYDKPSYEWCLDYKQMSKRCVTSTGSRDWTKEEMMAYLDWSKAEDERVEAQVAEEMGDDPLANRRRGVKDIWGRIEADSREQDALHLARGRTEDCIIVGSNRY
ncbi:Misshapen-like kinase 1 [Fusarium oxysporum f. sp. albedinis]|nr:PKS-NRPS hybrid synthetase [Fusarium oxysporum f. sp. conglutinans]KAJ0131036.1 Misshapen-like kinase 1 [Fusarium oxysporum f. sp. albedinis]RKK78256.1 hypothetical protein BFJ71_g16547 [Fusarium oxysporum]KAG6989644.1 PKS-NRPS hybrid synthetase [Fusarium oxysporum f. sp. conglutinans]KAG6990388.1 PKS-NRPS hybrid synthetase [Fusarium oxysporum f. sp. conglutinans]